MADQPLHDPVAENPLCLPDVGSLQRGAAPATVPGSSNEMQRYVNNLRWGRARANRGVRNAVGRSRRFCDQVVSFARAPARHCYYGTPYGVAEVVLTVIRKWPTGGVTIVLPTQVGIHDRLCLARPSRAPCANVYNDICATASLRRLGCESSHTAPSQFLQRRLVEQCQSARKRDPGSASKRDPLATACAGSP